MHRYLCPCLLFGLLIPLSPLHAQKRELSPDRPDTTESPYTVDRGVFQLEMSFLDYLRDEGETSWSIVPFNLKLGLSHDVDLQLVVEPYRDLEGGSDGFGDTQLRLKVNLWGNDGGKTAFALMPFVSFPTSSESEEIEGGLILPLVIGLSERAGLGLMLETDFVYDPEEDSHDTELVLTAALGLDLSQKLGLYLEVIAIDPADSGANSQQLFGTGLTWSYSEDVIFDAGINVGLNDTAEDFNAFSGMTVRF